MKHFEANFKTNFKGVCKKTAKRVIQQFYLPAKDRGKKWYFSFLSEPIAPQTVFYESFAGLGILDNPRAIFQYLLSAPDFADYTHIWSVDHLTLAAENIREFALLSNVKIVQKDSREYYHALATSKYLISNSTFGYYFEKRQEQIYINTWHGVPTKYMGYEHAIERVENARGPARNFLSADYLISANRFMTDVMYRRAYKLDGLFQGKILEVGYPRLDCVIHPDTAAVYRKLNDLGIDTDKKIILYAPTWKGNLYNQLDYNIEDMKSIVRKLSEHIDTQTYRIYLRVHYFLYKILAEDPELKKILIPFTIDTNELLSVVDVLISDYSSIFFDFLATGRPMLFYVPDLEEYRSGRGLYVPVTELPGLVSADLNDIASALQTICIDAPGYLAKYAPQFTQMCSWCTYNEDGNACKRLVDIVFRGQLPETQGISAVAIKPCDTMTTSSIKLAPLSADCHGNQQMHLHVVQLTNNPQKKRVLICINTRCNDLTVFEKLRNTLSEMDFSTTDVTVLTTSFKDEKHKTYFHTLPDAVRILVWYALPFVPKESAAFYRREVVRTLGNTAFDKVQIAGNITEYWANFANAVIAEK